MEGTRFIGYVMTYLCLLRLRIIYDHFLFKSGIHVFEPSRFLFFFKKKVRGKGGHAFGHQIHFLLRSHGAGVFVSQGEEE